MSSRCRDNLAPAGRCIVVLGALWFAVAPSLLRSQPRAAAGKTYDEILDTYVYFKGIVGGQWGITAAAGLIKGILGTVLVIGANMLARKAGQDGLFAS